MAYSESQPTVGLIAETTFSSGDLYKFVQISTDTARVSVVATTVAARVVGTLLSETFTTSTGANEKVTVGLLQGIGKVYMASSTLSNGAQITASSDGFGIVAVGSSDVVPLGYIVDGQSGTTGRIHAVLFTPLTQSRTTDINP